MRIEQLTSSTNNLLKAVRKAVSAGELTSDGLCAAYTRSLPADAGSLAGSTMLEVWDLQTDRTIDLLVASPSDYPVLLTWLEAEPAAGR